MDNLFGFLSLVSIICIIIGLIKPTIFSKIFRKNATRGKLSLIFIAALITFLVLLGITAPKSEMKQTNTAEKNENISAEKTKTEQETKVKLDFQNIEVSSQIVKKVEKKCRYFFGISNKNSKEFNGSISISLHNEKQSSALGVETFNTTTPMPLEGYTSQFIEINTCPVSIHGESGITKFKYIIKTDNIEIKTGEGVISNKFEDLSAN